MLITSTAKRLPYSDHIVCLDPKGEITAQGTFADLNGAGGYVSSFSLPRADWTYIPEIHDEIIQVGLDKDQDGMAVIQPKESDSDASFTLNETAYPREGEGTDGTSRRTGDVQIYLYYIKSVGWIASLVFVVAITGFVFCISFPSTYHSTQSLSLFSWPMSLTAFQQQYGCSGGLPTTKTIPTAI
jgi:ATP-binding cassette, subfamily C (CFTR/MRP), member 1